MPGRPSARCARARKAGQMPTANTTTTVASAPRSRTSASNLTPVYALGDAGFSERGKRRQCRGDDQGAGGAENANDQIARQTEGEQLSAVGAQGGHRGVVLAFDDALADKA